MPQSPNNQPSFNIQQVGNINTGDVTIQGDQVGIQHNYAQEQSLTEAAAEIQQLLTQLAQTYPNEADRQVEVVKREAKHSFLRFTKYCAITVWQLDKATPLPLKKSPAALSQCWDQTVN